MLTILTALAPHVESNNNAEESLAFVRSPSGIQSMIRLTSDIIHGLAPSGVSSPPRRTRFSAYARLQTINRQVRITIN